MDEYQDSLRNQRDWNSSTIIVCDTIVSVLYLFGGNRRTSVSGTNVQPIYAGVTGYLFQNQTERELTLFAHITYIFHTCNCPYS